MSHYVIGDVQGCWKSLQSLLQSIAYNPNEDRVFFAGDILNRGQQSLDVVRFVMDLNYSAMILGNHEIYCLITALGYIDRNEYDHTLHQLFDSPDCTDICNFLSSQPLIKHLPEHNAVIAHAGIPPQWSLAEAKLRAARVEQCLQDPEAARAFLPICFGDTPAKFEAAENEHDQIRYTVNAFTRMRFCTADGELELLNKTLSHPDPRFKPWFEWPRCEANTPDILFGHWAAQDGVFDQPGVMGLDTGCVYGKALTAVRLEDRQLFSVQSIL